jgi:hypothetical protein
MQALYDLVHSMAKEEKRLYHQHGRQSRFTQIYKGYLQASQFSKELDRELYQKHFATFSKAFYSMQKSALLDDILAVLLEYSNSSRPEFCQLRLRAKSDVLLFRQQPDPALNYLRQALECAMHGGDQRGILRLLEDYRDALSRSETATWEEYEDILRRIAETRSSLARFFPVEQAQQALCVIIATARQSGQPDDYRHRAWEYVELLQQYAGEEPCPETIRAAFEGEYQYALAFEVPIARHKRLVQAERNSQKAQYPRPLRMRIVNLLLRSSMECGDFLLINGIIYKTNKDIALLSEAEKLEFLPTYYELCSLYHFYENELTTAQAELNQLLTLPHLSEAEQVRHKVNKVSYQIAANMPRAAQEALDDLFTHHPETKLDLFARLLELIIAIEANHREEAITLVQRLRVLLRKSTDARKLAHYRLYLELVQKLLSKKKVQWQDVPGFNLDWQIPLKPNLWLKAKMENKFYYNYILSDWQGLKKILNV